jgi:hypothetical protein
MTLNTALAGTDEPDPSTGTQVSTRPVRSGWWPDASKWLPLALAVVSFGVMCTLVLSHTEKMIEPDPYAYRASIAALEDGNVTLTQDQYDQVTRHLQQTPLGGGISQWHQIADGTWISEKNPGYPFLAIGFDAIGAMRLAPLFYGALACIGLWFGARRWLGRWGGTFAVGAYCSAAIVMVMAWRSFMPTFTDASLVACGLGLVVWSTLALDRSRRARVIIGALAFFSLSLAVFVRYTNVAVLAVAALFALLICVHARWKLGWTTLLWWALAALPPLIASLAYNAVVFDGPFSTGYSSTSVRFTAGSVPENLKIMPSQLWRAMPVFVIGLAAVIGIITTQVWYIVRHRPAAMPVTGDLADPPASTEALDADVDLDEVSRVVADRWIGLFLLGAWAAIWGVYAAYQWTAQVGGGSGPFGGRAGGGGAGALFGGGALGDSGFLHPNYSIVRFYLPAMGAIALLAAWLIVRLPRVLGVLVIIGLFVAGGAGFVGTVNGQWAKTIGGAGGFPAGGGPGGGPGGFPAGGGPGGGRFPDLSKCPNLQQLGRGDPNQVPPGTLGGGDPQNGGPPSGLTFDENGCPVLPTTTTVPTN